MTLVGAGDAISDLRKKIQQLGSEIDSLGTFEASPELIESANLLHSNEHLSKKARLQEDLLHAYKQYSEALEQMLASVFEIQADLKEILKEQSELLSKTERKKQAAKSPVKSKRRRRQ